MRRAKDSLCTLSFPALCFCQQWGGKAMKPWFGPRLGTNVGYGSYFQSYDVMPVSWEGWLVTLVYFAAQVGAAFATGTLLAAWRGAALVIIVQLIGLHLVYLWFASRHYVTRAQMEPSVLPADMRDPKLNE